MNDRNPWAHLGDFQRLREDAEPEPTLEEQGYRVAYKWVRSTDDSGRCIERRVYPDGRREEVVVDAT